MITKEQALTLQYGTVLHENGCKRIVGPRNGITTTVHQWRVSGQPVTYRTRPDNWYVPIKFGLRQSSKISVLTQNILHLADECPLLTLSETTSG